MFNKAVVAFVIQFILQISEGTILYSCCEFQNSFIDGKCINNKEIYQTQEDFKRFPNHFSWLSSENQSFSDATPEVKFNLRSEFPFTFSHGTPTSFIISKENQLKDIIFSDGYLVLRNGTAIPPTEYCINNISSHHDRLQIFAPTEICSSQLKCQPKCCPWRYASRWLHPNLCYRNQPTSQFSSNMIPPNRSNKLHIPFYIQTLDSCIKKNKIISTSSINIFNKTQLGHVIKSLTPGSYCFDDVITSHDMKFDWTRDQALFYCEEDWPTDDFGLTMSEEVAYGICLGVSSIFLLIAISIYSVKLCKTHCQAHTFVEYFYMISLLLLGCFCVMQVYFPENQENFCTLYHFFTVFGYTLFAISLFSWATLLSLDLFIAFKELRPLSGFNSVNDIGRLCIYCLIGFSFPLVVTISTFSYSYIFWKEAGFCIPVQFPAIRAVQATLLMINSLFFICTFILIMKHRQNAKFATGGNVPRELNQLVICFVKLFIISGITYGGVIFGFVTGTERDSSWYFILFRMFLNLRGVTVFFIYVFNQKMKTLLYQFLQNHDGILCECFSCRGEKFRSSINRSLHSRSTLRRSEIMSL